MFKSRSIVSAPFEENTYIAHLEGRNDCLVVDPGLEPDEILAYLDAKELTPAAILITHGHSDHIAGNGATQRAVSRLPDRRQPRRRRQADRSETQSVGRLSGSRCTARPADVLVGEGDVYRAAGFDLLVREIPGHSERTRGVHLACGAADRRLWRRRAVRRQHRANRFSRRQLRGAGRRTSTPSCSRCPTTPRCCPAMVRRRPSGRRSATIRTSARRPATGFVTQG